MIPEKALLGGFPNLKLIIIARHEAHMSGHVTDDGHARARHTARILLDHLASEYPSLDLAADSLLFLSAPADRAWETCLTFMSVLGKPGSRIEVIAELDDNRMDAAGRRGETTLCRDIILAIAQKLTQENRILFISAHLPHAESLPQFLVPHLIQGKERSMGMGDVRLLDTEDDRRKVDIKSC